MGGGQEGTSLRPALVTVLRVIESVASAGDCGWADAACIGCTAAHTALPVLRSEVTPYSDIPAACSVAKGSAGASLPQTLNVQGSLHLQKACITYCRLWLASSNQESLAVRVLPQPTAAAALHATGLQSPQLACLRSGRMVGVVDVRQPAPVGFSQSLGCDLNFNQITVTRQERAACSVW